MASFTVPCPKCISPSLLGLKSKNQQGQAHKLSFQNGLSLNPCQSFGSSSGMQCHNKKQIPVRRIQAIFNEATSTKSFSNSVPVAPESGATSSNENGKVSGPSISADPSAISAFMTQVADLVKLVDSRDIVELELKQLDCELMIRKKEALEPPPATAVAPMLTSMPYYPSPPPPPAAAAAAPASTPASPPPSKPAPALPSPAKPSSSSHPPLKCPMAGTFYRSPGPGEPPFVKVGDKVQKGQVVCIIEAMKLMNEIEADQSGTITEILVDDGKQVSVDMPLFVIVP